jgi:hypothetical protein
LVGDVGGDALDCGIRLAYQPDGAFKVAAAALLGAAAKPQDQENSAVTISVRVNHDGQGHEVDWRHLATEAPLSETSSFLGTFDSYDRVQALYFIMALAPSERRLRIFLEWANGCDAPWAWRSDLAGLLRSAITKVGLRDLLGPEERAFHEGLPDLIPIWRGCERGRERGLHWTVKREVAEGFAQGKRCVNANPILVSAMVPKPRIFGVFLDRNEWELAVDPRRLRRIESQAVAPAAWRS